MILGTPINAVAHCYLSAGGELVARETTRAAIRLDHEFGVWLEDTTLVIPGLNDTDDELRGMAGFIRSVSPDIPWHISQFRPTFKMKDRPRTPATVLHRARQLGIEAGLRYVYEGNIPGHGNEKTYCHQFRKTLIDRYGFMVLRTVVRTGGCPDCGAPAAGVEISLPARSKPDAA